MNKVDYKSEYLARRDACRILARTAHEAEVSKTCCVGPELSPNRRTTERD